MKTTAIFTTRTTLNEYSKGLEFKSHGDGTCSVSGIGTCTDTDVKIPSVYNGEKVKSIGQSAFEGCIGMKSITIPDSVTSIGRSAFEGCISLNNIIIPDSVKSIGNYTFEGCISLTNIIVPDSVKSIGQSAFHGCISLNKTINC